MLLCVLIQIEVEHFYTSIYLLWKEGCQYQCASTTDIKVGFLDKVVFYKSGLGLLVVILSLLNVAAGWCYIPRLALAINPKKTSPAMAVLVGGVGSFFHQSPL